MGSDKKTRRDEDDVSSDRPVATLQLLMESLVEAQRLANELKAYLQLDPSSTSMDPLPLPAGALPALVEGISESLSRAIMLLLLQSQPTGRWSASTADHAGAKQLMLPAPARRRSGSAYKRRTQLSEGRRKELRSSMDDGYSWRKYGQKEIFAAKYPRSYFRCKHKYDQLCPATRQVQQSEADPSMLEITYIADHSCTQERRRQAASNASIIKHEDVPSTDSPRDHQAPADGGAPAHLGDILDGSFPSATASDLQTALELDGHGDELMFDGRRCYTNTYDDAAAAGDDELAAAASSFGAFTGTSSATSTIWDLNYFEQYHMY